jgi:hypothetical protein
MLQSKMFFDNPALFRLIWNTGPTIVTDKKAQPCKIDLTPLSGAVAGKTNWSNRKYYKMNYYEPLRIVQNAYIVQDLDEAIERWHATLGLGPFVVSRHPEFERSLYRGAQMPLDISVAFVQAGNLQIELICQHNPGPSAFRDMFAEWEEGLHHVAVFPEDYARLVAGYEARGCAVAAEIETALGLSAAFIDTRETWGHMLEVYRVNDGIRAFYRLVADAAHNWDGRTLTIELNDMAT